MAYRLSKLLLTYLVICEMSKDHGAEYQSDTVISASATTNNKYSD